MKNHENHVISLTDGLATLLAPSFQISAKYGDILVEMSDFLLEPWRVLIGVAVMLLVWWRHSQKPLTLNISQRTAVDAWKPPLLAENLPVLPEELHDLLVEQGEPELAAQIAGLRIVDRCRCGDDFCATFYVRPKPRGAYGPEHRNVPLTPKEGMLILDVVGDKIAAVEVLYRDDIRKTVERIVP